MVDRFMSPEEAARKVAGGGAAVCAQATRSVISPRMRYRLVEDFCIRASRPYSPLNDYDMRDMAREFLDILEAEMERCGHRIVELSHA